MAKKTVTIEAETTYAVWKILPAGVSYSHSFTPYEMFIGYDATTNLKHGYGSYEWTFTSGWKTGAGISGTVTVESAYVEFYYQAADNPLYMPEFNLVRPAAIPSGPGTASSGWALINNALVTVATVTTVRGDKKNLIRVAIDDASALATAINTPGSYSLGFRRTDTTRETGVDVGGNLLIAGIGTGWSTAGSDVAGPPKLVVTLEVSDATHVEQELRYTASDPTTDQNTPSNSLGGYFAPNEVFTTAQIGDFVSSTDTTVTIDDTSSLPSSAGIAQIGPEIISFTGIDTTNRQLTGVTRGVAPQSGSFPSEVDQFPEYIRYLVVDDLFDKKPSAELAQYHCLAVIHLSSTALNNVSVALLQNSAADVQVDIGIEVPLFDATTGTAQTPTTSGDTSFTSVSAAVTGKATGYYDGAHIIMDPGTTDFEAIVDSYDDDGGTAAFILDRALPTLDPAPSFRINPAPAQTVVNERTRPTNNNGRFFGFLGEGGESSIGYDSIRENVGTLNQYDVFYLWIKRTLIQNKKSSNNTGAIILVQGTQ